MFARRKFVVGAFGLACLLAAPRCSFGIDAAFVANVKSILTDGWAGGDAGLNKATSSFATAQQLVPGDFRPSYAWTLVQMKIGNFKQAGGIVSGVVADHPDEIGPREAQIWMHANAQEYPQMLTSIMALAVHLPRSDSDTPNDEQKEAAKFLGRVFGYFTGPGAGRVPDAKWEQREKLITDNLHSTLRDAFNAARDEVFKKSGATDGAKGQPKPDDKPPIALPDAAGADSVAGTGSSDSSAAAAALKAKFLADKADLEKRAAALQAEVSKLAGQAQPISIRVQQAQQAAQTKNYEAQTAKNPQQAANLRKEAQNLLNAIVKDQQDYNKLNTEATAKNTEITQLKQKLTHLTVQYKADMSKLGPAGSAIAAATPVPEKTPTPTPPVKTPATASEELTTLDGNLPLNLNVFKQQLIDSLTK